MIFVFKCGLIGHRKCIRFLVIRCPRIDLPVKIDVFGVNLKEVVGLPQLMVICINELERRGFNKLKGIYRTSGNCHRVAQICASFQSGPQLIDLRDCSHNDVTDVIKIYLNKVRKLLELINPFSTA